MNATASTPNVGAVVSVRGSVVDVRFDGHLPAIYSVLHAGEQGRIVIEVLAQRDARHVRGIALTPTEGLARGMPVEDTGGPLKAPVGKGVLSRMFDVFGHVIDRGAVLSDVEWRSVHRAPPPLSRRSTKSEVFETGIKVIDVRRGRDSQPGLPRGQRSSESRHEAAPRPENRERRPRCMAVRVGFHLVTHAKPDDQHLRDRRSRGRVRAQRHRVSNGPVHERGPRGLVNGVRVGRRGGDPGDLLESHVRSVRDVRAIAHSDEPPPAA